MSVRTFIVFQDTPSSDAPKPKTTPSVKIFRPSATSAENSNDATLTATIDKENVHPLTGERAGPSSTTDIATKKRKTNVLATKVHVPVTTKKQKGLKEAEPEGKKRKSSASSSTKGRTVAKKDSKGTGSGRKTSKRSTRKVSPMPKVDEEGEGEKERERITQAGIDSRCYELTVKPLADVSQAYEQSSPLESLVDDEKVKFGSIKGSSAEPEIRDYFSPPLGSSTRFRAPSEELQEAHAFSTPERKQIYAAFTFASPSPTSERFSKLARSRSPSPTTDLA